MPPIFRNNSSRSNEPSDELENDTEINAALAPEFAMIRAQAADFGSAFEEFLNFPAQIQFSILDELEIQSARQYSLPYDVEALISITDEIVKTRRSSDFVVVVARCSNAKDTYHKKKGVTS